VTNSELVKLWPGETYPGDVVLDDRGNEFGSTATILTVVVAGGHDVDLLRRSPALPATVKIFGMVFDIDSNEFTVLIPASERN
jgi:hypothetical protein